MNDDVTIENARIERVRLYLCDHGSWTSTLMLAGSGWGQGYGGWRLHDGPWMGLWVRGVCEMLGVDDWSKVQGSVVRIRRRGFAAGTEILAIGHLIDERWFDFAAIVKANTKGRV